MTEAFWQGSFGDDYTGRNADERLIEANRALFLHILGRTSGVKSIVELGCNRGLNLQAINSLFPQIGLTGCEINAKAAEICGKLQIAQVFQGNLLNMGMVLPSDLAFTKGVLIHVPPADLERAYKALVRLAHRYVLICEYYGPEPVMVPYRGESDRLWKRDFAGEMMERFDLTLVDYGFVYHGDRFPQDDLTWFLMEKGWALLAASISRRAVSDLVSPCARASKSRKARFSGVIVRCFQTTRLAASLVRGCLALASAMTDANASEKERSSSMPAANCRR